MRNGSVLSRAAVDCIRARAADNKMFLGTSLSENYAENPPFLTGLLWKVMKNERTKAKQKQKQIKVLYSPQWYYYTKTTYKITYFLPSFCCERVCIAQTVIFRSLVHGFLGIHCHKHGVCIAFIEGPVVKLLLMRHSPEETIEKVKKVINERLDGEEIIWMGMSIYI